MAAVVMSGHGFDVRRWVAAVTVCGFAIMVLGLLTLVRTLRRDCTPMSSADGVGWLASLRSVEEALANQDTAAARLALECARRAAYAGAEWRAMLEVGAISIRIGVLEGHDVGRWQARQDYLEALLRAYRGQSLDGVLESAEAFAALGDRDVVAQATRMANELAGRDVEARERVQAFGERFTRAGAYSED